MHVVETLKKIYLNYLSKKIELSPLFNPIDRDQRNDDDSTNI